MNRIGFVDEPYRHLRYIARNHSDAGLSFFHPDFTIYLSNRDGSWRTVARIVNVLLGLKPS